MDGCRLSCREESSSNQNQHIGDDFIVVGEAAEQEVPVYYVIISTGLSVEIS